VLCGAAIAGPLFGGIAGSSAKRWSPLVTGCALSVVAFAAIAIVLSVTPSGADDAAARMWFAPERTFAIGTGLAALDS
jgi:branched-subunit amino acid ABC-type transport system permease component